MILVEREINRVEQGLHLAADDLKLVATRDKLVVRRFEEVLAGHKVHVLVPLRIRALHCLGTLIHLSHSKKRLRYRTYIQACLKSTI